MTAQCSLFIATIDTLAMGRDRFEQMRSSNPWPSGGHAVVAVGRTMTASPVGMPPTMSLTAEAPAKLVARLPSEGRRHLDVGGGMTIQSCPEAGLIDVLHSK